jgi:uncharacterized membrane protein
MIQRIPEVELAKQAMRDGKPNLARFYKRQRRRSFAKELEKALADGHQTSAIRQESTRKIL